MPSISYPVPGRRIPKDQEAIFDNFWHQFGTEVANGEGRVDCPDPGKAAACHLTAISYLPGEVATELLSPIQEIQQLYPNHYFYPPEDLHFTYLNLDHIFTPGVPASARAEAFEAINAALIGLPSLEVDVRRVGLFPTAVFAEVYDISGELENYRAAISGAAQEALGLPRQPHRAVIPKVSHVNMVRFRQTPDPETVLAVKAERDRLFGSFVVGCVDIVTTDRLVSAANTTLHQRIRVGR